MVSIVGYWVAVSFNSPDWTGGWSYGPRLLADVAPLIVWFVPPALEAVERSRSRAFAALAAALIVLSVLIQAHGAFDPATSAWNWTSHHLPSARVWDWSDPQFLA